MFRPLLSWRARVFSVVLYSLGAAHGLTSPGGEARFGFLPARVEPASTLSAAAHALRHRAASAPGFSRVVWMFYDKPIEQADPISRVCVSGWKLAIEEYNKTIAEDKQWQLLILSNESVTEYLTAEELKFLKTKSFLGLPKDGGLPKDIKGKNTWHSDLLRLRLLQIYGGMWVDASIFPFQIAEFGWIEELLSRADGENGPYDVIMKADDYIRNNKDFGSWEVDNDGASVGFNKVRAKWPVELQEGERIAPIPENHFIIAKRDAPLITAWLQRTQEFMRSLLDEWQPQGSDEDPLPLPEAQQPAYVKKLYGEKWKSQTPGKGLEDYQYRMAYFAFHAVMLEKYTELLARPQHSTSSPAELKQTDFNPARAFSLLVLPTTGALPKDVRTPGPELSADVEDDVLGKAKNIFGKEEKKSLSDVVTERAGKALGEVIMQKRPQLSTMSGAPWQEPWALGDTLGVARTVCSGNLELFGSMGLAEALGYLSDTENRKLMIAWRGQYSHRTGFNKFCGEMREILYVVAGAHMFGPLSGKGKDGEFSSNYEAAVLAEFGSKEKWESAMSAHLQEKGNKYKESVVVQQKLIPEAFVGLFAPESSSV